MLTKHFTNELGHETSSRLYSEEHTPGNANLWSYSRSGFTFCTQMLTVKEFARCFFPPFSFFFSCLVFPYFLNTIF